MIRYTVAPGHMLRRNGYKYTEGQTVEMDPHEALRHTEGGSLLTPDQVEAMESAKAADVDAERNMRRLERNAARQERLAKLISGK